MTNCCGCICTVYCCAKTFTALINDIRCYADTLKSNLDSYVTVGHCERYLTVNNFSDFTVNLSISKCLTFCYVDCCNNSVTNSCLALNVNGNACVFAGNCNISFKSQAVS